MAQRPTGKENVQHHPNLPAHPSPIVPRKSHDAPQPSISRRPRRSRRHRLQNAARAHVQSSRLASEPVVSPSPSSSKATASTSAPSAVADRLHDALLIHRDDTTPAPKKPRAASSRPLRPRNYVIEEDEITPAPPKETQRSVVDEYIPSVVPASIVVRPRKSLYAVEEDEITHASLKDDSTTSHMQTALDPMQEDDITLPPSKLKSTTADTVPDTTSDFLIAKLMMEDEERNSARKRTLQAAKTAPSHTEATIIESGRISDENALPANQPTIPKRRTRRQLQSRAAQQAPQKTPDATNRPIVPSPFLRKEVPPDTQRALPREPFREITHTRTAVQTYSKRRRTPGLEMPSMRSLGVVKPRSPGESSSKSGSDEHADKENEATLDSDAESSDASRDARRSNAQLDDFIKQQRLFWADVDQVQLEEDVN